MFGQTTQTLQTTLEAAHGEVAVSSAAGPAVLNADQLTQVSGGGFILSERFVRPITGAETSGFILSE